MKIPIMTLLTLATINIHAAQAPNPPKQQALGPLCAGLGATVVVTGGMYVAIKLWRFCAKKFGPSTNACPATNCPPRDPNAGPRNARDFEGASCIPWERSCPGQAELDSAHIQHLVISGSHKETKVTQLDLDGSEISWNDWAAFLGLEAYGESYSSKGESIQREDSRIQFFDYGLELLGDSAASTIHIERAHNLYDWEHVITLILPTGCDWELQDSTDRMETYYRITQ